jgi:beta-glucanase (GH16 family)
MLNYSEKITAIVNSYGKRILIFGSLFLLISCSKKQEDLIDINPDNTDEWTLSWYDDFNYLNIDALLEVWSSQNGPSTHILSSRWEDNIELKNGKIKLVARKEKKGGQDWTAAHIWTKRKFQYGYFECNYKYAAATGTNNSFWIMEDSNPVFEIDINEGNYPDIIYNGTHYYIGNNIVNSDGKRNIYNHDFSKENHLFGMEWTETELIFYLDRKIVRKVENNYCHGYAPLRLSLAIKDTFGDVTNSIDEKYMEADYVRMYVKNDK